MKIGTWMGVAVIASAAIAETAPVVRASGAAGAPMGIEYRVLATTRTSTMEKEMNAAAELGFQFMTIMGGETAVGGNEAVAIMARMPGAPKGRLLYKMLATNRTSTMEKEMQQAANDGFEYRAQTVFESSFGGREVACVMERNLDASGPRSEYRLLATNKTSTMQKELQQAGDLGFEALGLTVAKTAFGGSELVTIMRRRR